MNVSKEIVQFLVNERHLTLRKAAKLMECDASHVCCVRKGDRRLNMRHLTCFEKNLKMALPLILLKSASKSIPEELRPQYTKLREKVFR